MSKVHLNKVHRAAKYVTNYNVKGLAVCMSECCAGPVGVQTWSKIPCLDYCGLITDHCRLYVRRPFGKKVKPVLPFKALALVCVGGCPC